MFSFSPVADQDFAEYEYEIYNSNTVSSGSFVSSGKKRSTVFVVSVLNSTQTINPTTGSTTNVSTKYWGRVRAINTSGVAGPWTTPLVTHSGNSELISDQYIGTLTAAKITAGIIGAEQIILRNPSGTPTTYTAPSATSVIRSSDYVEGSSGWIIRGDGTAEFGAASIRGTLAAKSLYLDAYNRWGRNSTNTADESSVLVVGNATNQLYWNPTGGTGSGSLLKVGNSTNYMQWDNNTLTLTGAVTTSATITQSTAGGLTIGTNSLQFGSGGYKSSIMFVGWNTDDNVSANKFSIGSKLYYDGSTLAIDGTVTIAGTSATTVKNGAASGSTAIQPGGAASDVNSNTTTINGGKIRTGTIESTGYLYTSGNYSTTGTQINLDNGLIRSKNFAIDSSGNAFFSGSITASSITNGSNFTISTTGGLRADNILASASYASDATDGGIQILANGSVKNNLTATNGSIYIFNARYQPNTVTEGYYDTRIGYDSNHCLVIKTFYDASVLFTKGFETGGTTNSYNTKMVYGRDSDSNYPASNSSHTFHGSVDIRGGERDSTRVLRVNGDVSIYGTGSTSGGADYLTINVSSTTSTGNPIHFKSINGVTGLFGIQSLRSGKQNIDYVDDSEAISVIKKLTPRKYTIKPDDPENELEVTLKSLDFYYGFIAEEIEESVPQLATYRTTKEFQELWPNVGIEDIKKLPLTYYKETSILSLCVSSIQNLLGRIERLELQLATK